MWINKIVRYLKFAMTTYEHEMCKNIKHRKWIVIVLKQQSFSEEKKENYLLWMWPLSQIIKSLKNK